MLNILINFKVIKMMVGETKSTFGSVFVNGYEMKSNLRKARKKLGFCPQFDYLSEYLTVEQTLILFCQLKGILDKNVQSIIDEFMVVFKLTELKDKIVQNLR